MLQLIGFFLASLLLLQLLRWLPGIGGLFQVPLLGFFLACLIVSWVFSKLAHEWVERRRERRMEAQFQGLSTPHHAGKLGSLLLARGRARRARPHLERAVAGDEHSLEWRWKLAQAHFALRDYASALAAAQAVLDRDADYAYGEPLLLLARCQRRLGKPALTLEWLQRYEQSQGATPSAWYERGRALRALGRKQEARAAFAQVAKASATRVRWQRKDDRVWVLLAQLWRWL